MKLNMIKKLILALLLGAGSMQAGSWAEYNDWCFFQEQRGVNVDEYSMLYQCCENLKSEVDILCANYGMDAQDSKKTLRYAITSILAKEQSFTAGVLLADLIAIDFNL